MAEGDATQFIQQESGIIAAKVLADSNSSVSITLQPADMAGATELLSFIADFLIQVASLVDWYVTKAVYVSYIYLYMP